MQAHDHYRRAMEALDVAEVADLGSDTERYNLAAAQVHATLALAAAHNAHIVDAEIRPAPQRLPATTAPAQGDLIVDQMGDVPQASDVDEALCGVLHTGQFCHGTYGHTGSHLDEDGNAFIVCDDPWCKPGDACRDHREPVGTPRIVGDTPDDDPPFCDDGRCFRDRHHDTEPHVDADGREFR